MLTRQALGCRPGRVPVGIFQVRTAACIRATASREDPGGTPPRLQSGWVRGDLGSSPGSPLSLLGDLGQVPLPRGLSLSIFLPRHYGVLWGSTWADVVHQPLSLQLFQWP